MTADVSVVIPVHNGARYLAAAIESVLDQRPKPREVLVIDDGSTDRSARVAERFGGVRCLRQPHRGLGATHNRGVAIARGELVGFLDQDDLWQPGKLERQLAAYGVDDRLDVVFGHVRQFVSPELDARSAAGLRCPPRAEPGYLIGSGLFRREALARVGPFREDLVTGNFIDWMARARDRGLREAMLPDIVLRRRLHAANYGRVRRDARRDYARVLKAVLDRRRAAAGVNAAACG